MVACERLLQRSYARECIVAFDNDRLTLMRVDVSGWKAKSVSVGPVEASRDD